MQSPIAVRDLRKVYKSQGDRRRQLREVVALDGITFEIERGEFFGLLGPNGAGKTTTIGILTTRVRPTSAAVTIRSPRSEPPSRVRKRGGSRN